MRLYIGTSGIGSYLFREVATCRNFLSNDWMLDLLRRWGAAGVTTVVRWASATAPSTVMLGRWVVLSGGDLPWADPWFRSSEHTAHSRSTDF
eukprot:scaffold8449_cov23-Cyclotella_meneghiniana.AAC.4